MWVLLLVLGFGGVLVSGDDSLVDCSGGLFETCKRIDVEFPETEEELDELCPIAIRQLECIKSTEEVCERMDDEERDNIQRVISTIKEVCRKDSLLHAAIGGNLKCLKGSLNEEDADACNEKAHNTRLLYHEYQKWLPDDEIDEEAEYERYTKTMCLRDSYLIGCAANIISNKCGPVAKGAALEIFSRVPMFSPVTCQPHFAGEFMEIIPKLDISEEEKDNLLEVFQLK